MKRIGKKLLAAGLALSVLMLTPSAEAQAAGHFWGCESKLVRVECKMPRQSAVSTHTYYITETGPAYCDIASFYTQHEIYCANNVCNVYLSSEIRTCFISHSKCGIEIKHGVCQY